jgi:hypothetical protein
MKAELQKLIREAEKELRRASGQPLTSEEQAEDIQSAAIAELQNFVLPPLGVKRGIALQVSVQWTDGGAVAKLTADNDTFLLRRDRSNNRYILSIRKKERESELARIDCSDPLFGSRVLVAIGEAASA